MRCNLYMISISDLCGYHDNTMLDMIDFLYFAYHRFQVFRFFLLSKAIMILFLTHLNVNNSLLEFSTLNISVSPRNDTYHVDCALFLFAKYG